MLTAYSATTTDNLPVDARLVFAYGNPPFDQLIAAHARCPHARILPISTHPEYMGVMYDFESGAIDPADAGATVAHALWREQHHPVCYFSLSNHAVVVDSLKRAHIGRDQVRLCPAHYTTTPELPDWADGVQWTDHADGKSMNAYALRDDFFDRHPSGLSPARLRF